MLSCQIRSKLPLLRISLMLNFHLYLISRLSSHFYRLPKSKKPNLQSCGVDFQSVGLDDYERDRKSDHQAWRRDKYCQIVLILITSQQADKLRDKTRSQPPLTLQDISKLHNDEDINWDQTRSQPSSTIPEISKANSWNVSAQPKVILFIITIIMTIDAAIITTISDDHFRWWPGMRREPRPSLTTTSSRENKKVN